MTSKATPTKKMERKDAINKLKQLDGEELHKLAQKYHVTVCCNGKANKGWAGHVFERYLGLPINSDQKPDFGSWELKTIPLKYKKNGELTFKETMAITMIDPVNVCEKEFEESHLLAKLRKVVVIARTVGHTFKAPSYVHSITEIDLESDMYEAVKADYDLVRKALVCSNRDLKALSGKMGKYIQPRTKGAGHGSRTRAFYARPSFLKKFIKL